MAVDTTKIKYGDKVTVELTFLRQFSGRVDCLSSGGSHHGSIPIEDIVGHTPKPREFKVGDSIRINGISYKTKRVIVAIDGNMIVYKYDDSYNGVEKARVTHAD